jgi:hypothetical protein
MEFKKDDSCTIQKSSFISLNTICFFQVVLDIGYILFYTRPFYLSNVPAYQGRWRHEHSEFFIKGV